MKETESSVNLSNGKTIYLVDLPGFERLRMKYWDDYKQRAKAFIYVIDSNEFINNIRDVADLLYNYLVDGSVIDKKIPILVACNKQDETRAKSAKVIQKQLEREMYSLFFILFLIAFYFRCVFIDIFYL
jgi:signal recognition particle receptor subunit beta